MGRLQTLKPRLQTLKPSRLPIAASPDSWRADKRTSTQRGYGYKWQQARAGFLAKHPFCVMCLAEYGVTETDPADVVLRCAEMCKSVPYADVVNHRIPHRGDQTLFWDRSNWEPICKHHHDSDVQRRERQQGSR